MTFKLASLCSVVLLTSTLLCPPSRAADNDNTNQAFLKITQKEWAWRKAQYSGEDEEDSEPHGHDRLPKVDPKTQAQRLAVWLNVKEQLSHVKVNELTHDNQVNFSIYQGQIDALIASQLFKDYEKPLNADTTFWTNLTGIAHQKPKTVAAYETYLHQLQDIPRYFDDQIANMELGLKRGFTPPRVTLEGREGSIQSASEPLGEHNPYYEPFKSMPATISVEDQSKLRTKAVEVINHSVVPAHQKLLKFFTTVYIPGARTELAATTLPNGADYYRSKIREFTTTELTADEIHAIGLAEVSSIHAQMEDIIRQVNFKGSFAEFLSFLRTDPQFYTKTPDELLMHAAFIAKEFDGKAKDYFGMLPRARFAIVPVPPDMAPFYTAGRGGPGVYLVNTYNLPSRPLYALPALTLHESAPGHAFQMSLSNEHKDQPPFRAQGYLSGYGEGWALYCEKLGVEMGMYHTPYEMFGMLTYQMWRAARLVVDTGIHSKGWTREQAQRYLHDNTALSDHEIETEVDRYISWPGQALAYYLGERTILMARARAEKALGSKFNLKAFHDTILSLGSVPLPVLDNEIDRFIQNGGKGPYPDLE
jgi:uncharacterized protein (DUF885 family)